LRSFDDLVARRFSCDTVVPVRFLTIFRKIVPSVRFGQRLACAGLLLISGTVFADGIYQRSKDGKTFVWNQDPKAGDAATWSGDRDRDDYADGFGTLTWYTTKKGADSKEIVYGSFFGNMIRGKLDGPVNAHSKGVTNHALFNDGKRTTRWAAGPVRSWRTSRPEERNSSPEMTVAKVEQTNRADFNPPPRSFERSPAERPVPNYSSMHDEEKPASPYAPAEGPNRPESQRAKEASPFDAGTAKPKLEMDDSLRSLVAPPPSLGEPAATSTNSSGSVPGGARLTKEQVMALADAAARNKGYEPTKFQRSDPQFDQIDSTWSAVYEPVPGQPAKRFTVAVDDKSKRTAIVAAR
jgi:hypothetical protein